MSNTPPPGPWRHHGFLNTAAWENHGSPFRATMRPSREAAGTSEQGVALTPGLIERFFDRHLRRDLAYGPQAAWYAEPFPAGIRYSGASISYALGAVLGGAFASLISAYLVQRTGTVDSIAIYLVVMVLISLGVVLALRDRPGVSLSVARDDADP